MNFTHTDRSGPIPIKTEFHAREQEIYKITTYQSPKNLKWYWRLVAENGHKVADGSQGYAWKRNAVAAARRIVAAKLVLVES